MILLYSAIKHGYTYDFGEKLYLKSVIIGGNCRVNPGVRVSNWTVGSEFKWQALLTFSDNNPCGKLDSGNPSVK